MSRAVSDLTEMIRRMEPVRQPGVHVFASVPPDTDLAALEPVATVCEPEGVTVVVEESRARAAGLKPVFRAAWITLSVHSDLNAVGPLKDAGQTAKAYLTEAIRHSLAIGHGHGPTEHFYFLER